MRDCPGGHLLVTLLTQKPATNVLSGYENSGWVTYFALSLRLCPWEKGEGGTQRREEEVLAVFPVHGGTQSKPEYVWRHGQHCSEDWYRLCRPPVRKGEIVPYGALPHLYNIWHYPFATSLYICFLTSVHNVTGTVPPPPSERILSFRSGALSYPQIPAAYFWCDFHMHSTCRDVCLSLRYRQREYCLCPLPWPTVPQHCTFVRAHLSSCLFPVFPTVLAECVRHDTGHLVLPQTH